MFCRKLNLILDMKITSCKMVKDKVPIERVKPLVKDANYICTGCMRTAAKAENLCAPERL